MRAFMLIPLSTLLIAAPALALDATADQNAAHANFKQADGNGDGKLSVAEFRKFIDANAADGTGRAGMVKRFGAYDTAFAKVDTNKDGVVSKKEIAASADSKGK